VNCEGAMILDMAIGGLIGLGLVWLYDRFEKIRFQRWQREMLAEQEKHWPGDLNSFFHRGEAIKNQQGEHFGADRGGKEKKV